ncbi:MAG: hypothetical protein COW04_06195 [Deltaproteobacteria bacterium CG12_big_fil_rev_8_21_14_0_65_43_10]|nr:MAG: hypothetical protein COW04_06195 [Deltaproteobacteria bacterium CG12_big_fil_rev_8_21_14_0_65_43_10]PIU86728.1 MAG: hypothetical protein COS67_01005 [Deltaproteobacteria bacterium CG06_land_8_20_14_3_00_44_19]PIX24621.1 MAG: hypothetical protein COZ68_05895 [Deltaproteobacteria bacterium CG_4_8_14_3_um_filter_43_13]PIZ19872.1 MAG: hypothetical protein COY50_07710 [Deltaproteobacteria bacterium CG_4_10_14_0_8_um_filter_43_12]PJB45569.1 MAG: hypothetical protein CO106_01455 [Deltaproteoba
MIPNNDPLIIEEYQLYTAHYNPEDGVITIDFFPEGIAFVMKDEVRYQNHLNKIKQRINDCFRKSVNLLNNRQSTSEL